MLELGLGLKRAATGSPSPATTTCPTASSTTPPSSSRSARCAPGSPSCLRASVALARRYWLEMPKVAGLVPADADVVNAHEWLALRPGRIAAGRLGVPLVWTRNDDSVWERAIVPRDTISGDPRLQPPRFRAAIGWPDLRDARKAAEIAVLSAQQVEMVRRSYRKPAEVVGVGPRRTSSTRPTAPRPAPASACPTTSSSSSARASSSPTGASRTCRGDRAAGATSRTARADHRLRPRRPRLRRPPGGADRASAAWAIA